MTPPIRYIIPLILTIGLALGSPTPGGEAQGASEASRLAQLEPQVWHKRGQQLYRQACATCHGIHAQQLRVYIQNHMTSPKAFTNSAPHRLTPCPPMLTSSGLLARAFQGQ
jgi:mono/diheme cytochrome c family protein